MIGKYHIFLSTYAIQTGSRLSAAAYTTNRDRHILPVFIYIQRFLS